MAGQVVVAQSRAPQRRIARPLARGWPRHQAGHRLQRGGYVGVGQPVVAVAALRLDRDETLGDQPGQVRAGGGGTDAGQLGQFAGRQGDAVQQGGQHRRAAGLGQRRRGFEQVFGPDRLAHARSVSRRPRRGFVGRRRMAAAAPRQCAAG